MNPLLHYSSVSDCGQQVEFSVLSQHFSGDASFLPTNLTVIITPAARMMIIKMIFDQRLFFFFGVQQPSLQPQF
jgi:hypothetical protein